MEEALGVIEFKSIAKGIETLDIMTKAAYINVLKATTICSGKYLILITGDIGSVNTAIEEGNSFAGEHLNDSVIIPQIHPMVLNVLKNKSQFDDVEAIGVLEIKNSCTIFKAVDAAVKASNIDLLRIKLSTGISGKSYFIISGFLDDCKTSIQAAVDVIEDKKWIIEKIIIPRPHEDVVKSLM